MKFIGYFLIILGLIAMPVFLYESLTYDYSTKEVDCFDRFSNKIIGQTCLEEYQSGDIFFNVIVAIAVGFLITMVGFIIIRMEEQGLY